MSTYGAAPGFPASRNDFDTIIANYSGNAPSLNAGTVATIASHLTNYNIVEIGCIFDGAGSTIPTNQTFRIPIPCSGTIIGYDISTPDSGAATVATWKKAVGNSIPTAGDSISISGITLTTASDGTRKKSTVVTDFTTTDVAAYDMFAFSVTSVTSLTRLNFVLYIQRTDT